MQQPQEINPPVEVAASIHPATDVGTVTLKVADLRRSLAFYNNLIGLQTFQQDDHTATLGAGNRPILKLEEIPDASYLSRNVTGLYHAAILFPNRHSLAIKIAQIMGVK